MNTKRGRGTRGRGGQRRRTEAREPTKEAVVPPNARQHGRNPRRWSSGADAGTAARKAVKLQP